MVFGIESFARGMADQVTGEIAAAVAVDLLTKPMKEGLVVALVELVWQARQFPMSGLP